MGRSLEKRPSRPGTNVDVGSKKDTERLKDMRGIPQLGFAKGRPKVVCLGTVFGRILLGGNRSKGEFLVAGVSPKGNRECTVDHSRK